MLKDIQVYIDDTEACENRLTAALQLAACTGDAHIMAVHPIIDRESLLYAAPHGISGYFPEEVLEQQRRALMDRAARLKDHFEARLTREGALGEWRQAKGAPVDIVSFHARFTDLTIVSQVEDRFADELDFSGSLLLESGLPILAVPENKLPDNMCEDILVAWNGSVESARAVNGALPLLKHAKRVTILSAGNFDKKSIPQSDIAAHLARHGVACTTLCEGDGNSDQIIMNRAQAEGFGMIVAGAWGHHRIREMIFGGVTRTLLSNQQIPVLMSH